MHTRSTLGESEIDAIRYGSRTVRSSLGGLGLFLCVVSLFAFCTPNYDWYSTDTDTPYGADFLQEWTGARMLVRGQATSLYDPVQFNQWQHASEVNGMVWNEDRLFPPVYPPIHYMLFTTLALFPYRFAALLWMMTLVASLIASAHLIVQIASEPTANESGRATGRDAWIWIGLFLFPSVLFSIALGQKSVLFLLLVCMTWRMLQKSRDFAAGLVFGIMSIKPTLFFLLPLVMVRRGGWAFLGGVTSSVVLLWGTALCVILGEAWRGYLQGLGATSSYGAQGGYRLDWSCHLLSIAYAMPEPLVQWTKLAVCLPLGIYVLFCTLYDRHDPIVSPENTLRVFAATLLLSPHAYHYDLAILMLPILWLAIRAPRRALIYFTVLSVGITTAGPLQAWSHIPVIPVLLVGFVCELRLRHAATGQDSRIETAQIQLSSV